MTRPSSTSASGSARPREERNLTAALDALPWVVAPSWPAAARRVAALLEEPRRARALAAAAHAWWSAKLNQTVHELRRAVYGMRAVD